MILIVSSFVIFLYITASLFLFSSCRSSIKWLSIALLFIISQKYVLYEHLGGAFFAPALPRPFLLLMEALYGAMIVFFLMLLLKDALMLILWTIRRFGVSRGLPFPPDAFKAGVLSRIFRTFGSSRSVRLGTHLDSARALRAGREAAIPRCKGRDGSDIMPIFPDSCSYTSGFPISGPPCT